MKLKDVIINEGWLDEKKTLTLQEKKIFLEKVGGYNSYGDAIHSKHNLVEIAKELAEIARQAEILTISECGEEFDKVTVARNMKEMRGLSEQFSKVATEAHSLNGRLTALYEDMGRVLERYYEVNDAEPTEPENVAKDVDAANFGMEK